MARTAAGEALATRERAQAVPSGAQSRLARARAIPAWRDEPLVWAGAQIALLTGAVGLQASQPLNHDVGWLLVGARRLLAGAPLYRDGFLDVNPPAILAFFAPAVAAAGAFELPEILALRVWLLALCAGSLVLCHHLARLLVSEPPVLARAWLFALAFVMLVLPNRDFGQREHLIVLLLLPYLLDAALRARGDALSRRLAVAIGAGAGAAAAMKPQYALVVTAAELLVLVSQRDRRPAASFEIGAFGCVVGVAAAAIAWLYPDYFRVAVPLAAETYGAYQSPLASLVRGRDLALLAASVLTAGLLWRDGVLRPLASLLACASLAAWLAYLIGGTWWDYHRYPFRAFAIAALALAVAKLLARPSQASHPPHSRGGAVAAAVTAFVLTAGLLLAAPNRIGETLRDGGEWRAGRRSGALAEIAEVAQRRGHGGSIWLPASSVDPAFPAVNYAGVEWASRFSCLWPLPAVIQAQARPAAGADPARRERLDGIARWLVAAVSEDLERAKPELIFVSRTREHLGLRGIGFDFLAYLKRKPRFAKLWSQYAWVEDTPSFRVFARQAQETGRPVVTSGR